MMRITVFILTALFYLNGCSGVQVDSTHSERGDVQPQDGDIIFHVSKSSQSKAIQLATNSKYSHMGIVYVQDNKHYVYEAVQPVKLTPLDLWIDRGEDKHYVVKRLANSAEVLTPETLMKMKEVGAKYQDKDYDSYFEWSDDRMYCSELVWKIFKEAADIEIGQLERLGDFNLENEIVQQKIKERYGDKVPLDEQVISPAVMFNSEKLITVIGDED